MVKKGNALMKITFDDRAFIIYVLSIRNPHLIFEEGAEKNEILVLPTQGLSELFKIFNVDLAPLVIPEMGELDEEFNILYWQNGEGNFRSFKLRFINMEG